MNKFQAKVNLNWNNIIGTEDPRRHGKELTANYW